MDSKSALNRMAALCSKQEYCQADIVAKLQRWALSEQEIAAIMAFLVEHHFVDDGRFAAAYARDKFHFNRWGRLKIEQMLKRKRVAPAAIAEALAELSGEAYDETCLTLLRQKNRSLKEEDPYKRKVKLFRFALGRGFDRNTIADCIGRL